MIKFTVFGVCYSMKNSKTLTSRGGRPRMVKHWKASAFERDFLLQVPACYRSLAMGSSEFPLSATVTAFYPNRRQDLDVEIVWDLLQKAGVVSNDRFIRRKVAIWGLDPSSPRVEIEVDYL
jgi:Holliday junction resolvase RusA-like endonuclease